MTELFKIRASGLFINTSKADSAPVVIWKNESPDTLGWVFLIYLRSQVKCLWGLLLAALLFSKESPHWMDPHA